MTKSTVVTKNQADFQSTVQTNKTVKKSGSLGKKLILWSIVLFIFFIITLVLAIIIGWWGVPPVKLWLQDHNFIAAGSSQKVVAKKKTASVLKKKQQKNSDLRQYSNVVDVVNAVKDGVVSIAISDIALKQGVGISPIQDNIGTGFVVDRSGIIVTNQHVVSNLNATYKVVASDGKVYSVKDIIRDDVNDIALVIINDAKLTPLPLGNSDAIKVGEDVIAIGTPLGDFPGSVTKGIVSGLGRTVQTQDSRFRGTVKEYEGVIQTDAAVNPGNSGGPLVNMMGEVIAINFATTGGADNISFSLPVNIVKSRLAEFRKQGKFIRPFIGVNYQQINNLEAIAYDIPVGALVRSVVPNSPADKAGLRPQDIITKIDDKVVKISLGNILQKSKVGDTITLTIWRNGKNILLKLTLVEAP